MRRSPLLLLPLPLLLLLLVLVRLPLPAAAGAALPSACQSGATPFRLADECAPGFFCPLYNSTDATTFPVQCAPTDECTIRRLTSRFCPAQGTYEPVLCEAGHYCPTPLVQLPCPAGHICKLGTVVPIPCNGLSICPEGSEKRKDMTALVAIVIGDALLVACWFLAKHYRRARQNQRDIDYAEIQLSSVIPALHAQGVAYQSLPAHSKMLCQGFKRAQRELPPLRLQFDDLSMAIPPLKSGGETKVILKGVTGSIEPSKVTAIMGPSGAGLFPTQGNGPTRRRRGCQCHTIPITRRLTFDLLAIGCSAHRCACSGKTTFLTALLGRVDPSWTCGGSLLVNGADVPLRRFSKIIGYVPQDDVMHRDLSVYDNIRYSANVRLPASWSAQQRENHVAATISALQLKHVQDVLVGDEAKRGVSGGQRKRCNIGMEVAAAPSLLLLDEPTSGTPSQTQMASRSRSRSRTGRMWIPPWNLYAPAHFAFARVFCRLSALCC